MVIEDIISMDLGWVEDVGTLVAEALLKKGVSDKFSNVLSKHNITKLRADVTDVASEYARSGNMNAATLELLKAKDKKHKEFQVSFLYAVLCATPPEDATWFVTERFCPEKFMDDVKKDIANILKEVRDRFWNDPSLRERLSQAEINQFIIGRMKELEERVQAPMIVGGYPAPTKAFVGRDQEIGEIASEALSGRPVFVHGVRGMGKTETCKAVCRRLEEEGRTVAWMDYTNSIEETVASRLRGVCLRSAGSGDMSKVYEEKLVAMKATEDLVLVLDNFPEEGKATELMGFGVPTIITTDVPPTSGNYSKVEIKALHRDEAFELLCRVAEDKNRPWIEKNREAFEDLLAKVEYHTLVVSLIGGLVAKGEPLRSDPFESIIDLENIKVEDYGSGEELSVMDHVRRIFRVSDFKGTKE